MEPHLERAVKQDTSSKITGCLAEASMEPHLERAVKQ